MVASGAWTRTPSPSSSPIASCTRIAQTAPWSGFSPHGGCGSYHKDEGKKPEPTPDGHETVHPLDTNVRAVWVRDDGVCWLCGLIVPWRPPYAWSNHPLDPSRDHVLPRSKGGHGTADNLRLAHRWCNSARPNHAPEDMRRFIGRLLCPGGGVSPALWGERDPSEPQRPVERRRKSPKRMTAKRARKAGYLVQYRADGKSVVVVARR